MHTNLLKSISFLKGTKTIIVVTSDKCYEPIKNHPFIETDKLGGNDIYSASKACTEIISSSFRETFFRKNNLKLATVRAGNVLGGGDYSKDRLLPDLIKAYLTKKHCVIRNIEFTRPWQHVLDPLNGYIKLAKKMGPGHNIVTILCDHGKRYASKIFNKDFLKSKNLPVPNWL